MATEIVEPRERNWGEIPKIRRQELLAEVYRRTHCRKRDVTVIIDTFFDVLKDCFVQGSSCEYHGFGSFILKKREWSPERLDNLHGRKVEGVAQDFLKFKVAEALGEAIRDTSRKRYQAERESSGR